MQYAKVADMGQVALPVYSYIIIDSSQLYNIYLVNSKDTSRRILMKNSYGMTFYCEDTTFSFYEWKRSTLTGHVRDMNDTFLSCTIFSEKTEAKTREIDFVEETEGSWNVAEYRKINFKQLTAVGYSSPSRTGLHGSSLFFASLAGLDLLVVAPLVSIGYGHKSFNTSKYYQWAGIGLAGLGVTLPIAWLTQKKYYRIGKGEPSKQLWYFEKVYYR